MAGKYCCFIQPEKGYEERELTDLSHAGHPYGFPLFTPPKMIGDYEVIEPIDRGYYGATYVVKDSLLQKKVLKIIPIKIYKIFNKNFDQECIDHASLAQGSNHIVGINNKFNAKVTFPEIATIDCHVAVLDYVEGITLKRLMESTEPIEARKIAQLTIDLFSILIELSNKQQNHNDLHAGNLIVKKISEESPRYGQIHKYVQVYAIDLGSLSGESKSADGTRTGDVHWVGKYIKELSEKILRNKDALNANEYRLAFLLDEVSRRLFPKAENQRISYDDVIQEVKNAFIKTYSPWTEELSLNTFSDLYNAQSMAASHIPSLYVDPENKWIKDISNRGALVITGMRGCGKTMLLRALEFHARAVPQSTSEKKNTVAILERLQNDNYLGLYVSSARLLDKLGKPENEPLFEPYSRLFIAYSIQALETLNHLKYIDIDKVIPNYYDEIKRTVSSVLGNKQIFSEVRSEEELKNKLIDILASLGREESTYKIDLSPVQAFPQLAEAVLKCSELLKGHYVFFLLDDVSTRYFDDANIIELLSSLIFQNEKCSFKITSEAQTIQLMLHAPGKIANAKIGRDLESYDLGQQVYNLIKENFSEGKKFIEKILIKRTQHFEGHPAPNIKPSELLGDITLGEIAENICNYTDKKGNKNRIYHGMSALAGICVGDIGEVIKLYESILNRWAGVYPIPQEIQSENFRNLSTNGLFQLNRVKKELNLKDYAESFAEAAHELLKKSHEETPNRLREYYSIYVDISKGKPEEQDALFNKLIELIDAGIFVFLGGSSSPRTTNRYTNPLTQFVLIYRKLYGITKLIGLQHGDRFEISGDRLSEWLNNPKKGKEILKRGLGTGEYKAKSTAGREKAKVPKKRRTKTPEASQKKLFIDQPKHKEAEDKKDIDNYILEKLPQVKKLTLKEVGKISFDSAVIGLGFEERTEVSARKVFELKPKLAQLIEYTEPGRKKEILKQAKAAKIKNEIISVDDFDKMEIPVGNVLIDISGLSKDKIFRSVQDCFQKNRKVYICHTKPESILPHDKDILSILGGNEEKEIDSEFLETISNELAKGEEGPYTVNKLIETNTDDLKNRILLAYSSPKYERVLKILDERDFDYIELTTPNGEAPKDKLAKLATEIITRRFNYCSVTEIDYDNMKSMLSYIGNKYYQYHINNGSNFELAITGSKRQTVSSAIICSIFQISRVWYTRPMKWDINNFSTGVGMTDFFEISFPDK